MSKNYVAVVRRSDDDVQHWKYIKRVKGKNGRWVYTYERENGERANVSIGKEDSDKLTEMTKEISAIENKNPYLHISKKQYDRSPDDEKKKIDDAFEEMWDETRSLSLEREKIQDEIMAKMDQIIAKNEMSRKSIHKGNQYVKRKLLIK